MFSPPLQRALDDARTGKLAQSIADVRRSVQRHPRDLDSLLVLGLLLVQDGQLEQASHQFARCVQLAPGSAPARSNYAGMLVRLGRHTEAAEQLRRAVAISPQSPDMWMNLSFSLLAAGDAGGAIEAARRGLELAPGSPALSLNLALAVERSGEPEEGLRIAEAAHAAHPADAKLHSQYLLMLNGADRSAESIGAAHRKFGELHTVSHLGFQVSRDPERPLRIGWLSADLRTHSVGFFAEPLLAHAPPWVDTTVFSTREDPKDLVAARLKNCVERWHAVEHLDDESLNRMIRDHAIDVLIETSGHTGDGRMLALALKPAPIIISAIGYPNTTGLAAVDYRLVDSTTDPIGSESLAVERLLRIDPCFLCYRPPDDAPVPQFPSDGAGVTFGSFNAAHKIGPRTAELWREVLERVPGSRLLLKSSDLRDAGAGWRVLARLAAARIDATRVEFVAATPGVREHLAMYSGMHIALDTFPYHGTTTTCEALWMGVPVVTLAGNRHAARVGASLLSAAHHPEWIAKTPAEFAAIAAGLASDREKLREIRMNLRHGVGRSVLSDGPAYAAKVYEAVRGAWREYCRG